MRAVHTYPEDIYRCFDLCWYSSLRDFESVRTKASSKRLIYMCTHPCRFCIRITDGLGWDCANVTIIFYNPSLVRRFFEILYISSCHGRSG